VGRARYRVPCHASCWVASTGPQPCLPSRASFRRRMLSAQRSFAHICIHSDKQQRWRTARWQLFRAARLQRASEHAKLRGRSRIRGLQTASKQCGVACARGPGVAFSNAGHGLRLLATGSSPHHTNKLYVHRYLSVFDRKVKVTQQCGEVSSARCHTWSTHGPIQPDHRLSVAQLRGCLGWERGVSLATP
jgi:hypothetical protein